MYANNNKGYSIIDGLQRYSTITDFKRHPGQYWSKQNKHDWLPKLFAILDIPEDSSEAPKVSSFFDEVVNDEERLGSSNSLLRNFNANLMTGDLMVAFENFVKDIDISIKNLVNLDRVKIPTIIFNGSPNELATVFENLNKTGTKLTKFQVFAASWDDRKLAVNKDENKIGDKILDILAKRYQDLQSSEYGRGLKIEGYNAEEFRQNRSINLAEFAHALGALIIKQVPSLYDSTSEDAKLKLRDTIGFYSLAICTNTDIRHLERIIDHMDQIQHDHIKIVSKLIIIAKNINDQLAPLLKKPNVHELNSTNKSYETGMGSDLKFLSYIAALWTCGSDKEQIKYTLNNLPAYFVSDDLKGNWSGSGDSRLASYYNNEFTEKNGGPVTYINHIPEKQLEKSFDSWLSDTLQLASIKFKSTIKCLVTIHANLTYGKFLESGQKFDYEHVISKQHLTHKASSGRPLYVEGNIPGGALGNTMYLAETNNRVKQGNNLWEDSQSTSASHESSLKIVQNSEYLDLLSYPSQQELSTAENDLDNESWESTITLISDRSRKMMHALAHGLAE